MQHFSSVGKHRRNRNRRRAQEAVEQKLIETHWNVDPDSIPSDDGKQYLESLDQMVTDLATPPKRPGDGPRPHRGASKAYRRRFRFYAALLVAVRARERAFDVMKKMGTNLTPKEAAPEPKKAPAAANATKAAKTSAPECDVCDEPLRADGTCAACEKDEAARSAVAAFAREHAPEYDDLVAFAKKVGWSEDHLAWELDAEDWLIKRGGRFYPFDAAPSKDAVDPITELEPESTEPSAEPEQERGRKVVIPGIDIDDDEYDPGDADADEQADQALADARERERAENEKRIARAAKKAS